MSPSKLNFRGKKGSPSTRIKSCSSFALGSNREKNSFFLKKNSGEGYDTDVQSWGVFCLWPQSFQGGDHWAVSFPFIDEGLAPKPFGINDGKAGMSLPRLLPSPFACPVVPTGESVPFPCSRAVELSRPGPFTVMTVFLSDMENLK